MNHKLIKKLSVVTMLGVAAIGGIGIVNNANPAKTQVVQAARVRTLPIKQYSHYIRLSHRKGTHYFKPVVMTNWSGEDIYTYNMHGRGAQDAEGENHTTVVGTKTIGSRHFFIVSDGSDKFLIPSKYFYAPAIYRVKSGQSVKSYDKTEDEGKWFSYETWTRGNGKFIVLNSHVPSGRVYRDGIAYRAIVGHNGRAGYIKESDIGKLQKTTGILHYSIF